MSLLPCDWRFLPFSPPYACHAMPSQQVRTAPPLHLPWPLWHDGPVNTDRTRTPHARRRRRRRRRCAGPRCMSPAGKPAPGRAITGGGAEGNGGCSDYCCMVSWPGTSMMPCSAVDTHMLCTEGLFLGRRFQKTLAVALQELQVTALGAGCCMGPFPFGMLAGHGHGYRQLSAHAHALSHAA